MSNEATHPGEVSEPLAKLSALAGLLPVDEVSTPMVFFSENKLHQVAQHLGQVAGRIDLFRRRSNDDLIFFDDSGNSKVMVPQVFRTWINQYVILYQKTDKVDGKPIGITLTGDQAGAILAATMFRRGVRVLRGVNTVRLPVIRSSGNLELLGNGYDEETGIFTVDSGLTYDAEMDIEAAKAWLDRVFASFPFADARSWSVFVAGLLALYIRHLPGGGGVRPGFLVLANKPETGKTVLAKAWQYPVLGRAPVVKMKKEEQLEKELEAFLIAGVPSIFLDNVYGGINSPIIDQMLTSEESEGRAMGGHNLFRAVNSAILFVTGNRLVLNDDAARRFLVVDIFDPNDPSARKVSTDSILSDATMKKPEWRALMLAVCWALVRNWDEAGRPAGSVRRGSFEMFSELLGGIVEAAGYAPPFSKPEIPDAINPDEADFAQFVEVVADEMGDDRQRDFTLRDLARVARSGGLFEARIGTAEHGKALLVKRDRLSKDEAAFAVDEGVMDKGQETAWGKFIGSKAAGRYVLKGGRGVMTFGKRFQARRSTFTITIS